MSCPAIVLTSLSGKIALYQAIREQVISHYEMARIIGADCDENCKAAPLVEEFIKIPPISDWSHHEVISFCKSEKISHIIPSRDGELDFWSQLAPELEENGIQVMVSSMEAINNCLDKYAFFQSYSQNSPIQPIPTTLRPEFLNVEKFVVKERYGHGSQTLGLDLFLENAKLHAQALEDPIFQPYGHNISFGEMDPEAKHAISHRADAFAKLSSRCFIPNNNG